MNSVSFHIFSFLLLLFFVVACQSEADTQTDEVDGTLTNPDNWEIIESDYRWYLRHRQYENMIEEVRLEVGRIELMEIVGLEDNGRFYAIVYYAGSPGTSVIASIYRAVLLDTEETTTLGDFPWKYESSDGTEMRQPAWHVNSDYILITDENEGTDFRVPI